MESIHLHVSVPVAAFRVAYARDYWETYPCPPPSTVYGMLLSMVGQEDRRRHRGAQVAVAMVSSPHLSVVLRTLWRIKEKNYWVDPTGRSHVVAPTRKRDFKAEAEANGWTPEFSCGLGLGANKTPDLQELLTDVRLSVWVRSSPREANGTPLAARVASALQDPASVPRFGALCLGESSHLIDEIRSWKDSDASGGDLLVADERGDLTLPIWPDHVGSKGTRWGQFRLQNTPSIPNEPPETAWVTIRPPEHC